MSQYLLIEKIKVQNANAASGFTWGFPAITHFLGFSHNLNRKLELSSDLSNINLTGCAVIAHEQHVHAYKEGSNTRFSQNKINHYLSSTTPANMRKTPPVIEEAKMNLTVSLLIPVDGYLGGLEEELISFINNASQTQRLAGGTVLSIANIELIDLAEEENQRSLRRRLLPGFVLQDRSAYLAEHFSNLQDANPGAELLDAWFDFVALKQTARPACNLVDKHLAALANKSEQLTELNELWLEHKTLPYAQNTIPQELISYFSSQPESLDAKTLEQWQSYLIPNTKTNANWEYVKKPQTGYLVPLMTGYKAISEVYSAGEIDGARDAETELAFVEAVHSIGEWQSVHRLKNEKQWQASIWNYTYEDGWYLCQQEVKDAQELITEPPSDDVYY